MGEGLALGHERGGRVLDEHESRVHPRPLDQEGRQAVVRHRVEEPVEPSFRDGRQADRGGCERVHGDRHRLAVEVPPRQHLPGFGEDHRIVRHRGHLDLDHALGVSQRVAERAVDLWRTSERIRVLHQMRALSVGGNDLALRQELPKVRRRRALPGVRTKVLQSFVE